MQTDSAIPNRTTGAALAAIVYVLRDLDGNTIHGGALHDPSPRISCVAKVDAIGS